MSLRQTRSLHYVRNCVHRVASVALETTLKDLFATSSAGHSACDVFQPKFAKQCFTLHVTNIMELH